MYVGDPQPTSKEALYKSDVLKTGKQLWVFISSLKLCSETHRQCGFKSSLRRLYAHILEQGPLF